jgi:[protein-PII] uridylyltransferase
VLGRYLPEWARIVAQMQFNMYHSYTVDEHTLRAVGVIADIAAGRLRDEHPLSVDTFPLIDDKEALFLAMLLHDTGKGGVGGQEKAGARSARQACERMGLEPERVELVAWLVEHHLVMSDFAQKRDVADPRTVAAFAQIVQNPERLRLLLVLTTADIRAVGPGVWNGWKGQLMRELFSATEAVFRGGRGSDPAAHFRRLQRQTAAEARERLVGVEASAGDWAAAMEDAYFTSFDLADQQLHAALIRRAAGEGGAAASARLKAERNATEVIIAASDREGLFADLASALSALGANVVGAKVYTSRTGQALDMFYVQDVAGSPFGADTPRLVERLASVMEAAGRGEAVPPEARRGGDLGRAAAFSIAPAVAVDNDASEDATVVEASGRDRPGLLAALARTLADAGLSIQSAHIDNYGERAVDAFYVLDHGKKLEGRKAAPLKGQLVKALDAGEGAPERGRPRLERARASVAR